MNLPPPFHKLLPAVFAAALFSAAIAAVAAPVPPPPATRLPPAGIMIAAEDRAALTAGVAALRKDIDELARQLGAAPTLRGFLPDVEIFHKAVDWALRYDEFFAPKELAIAREMLQLGHQRCAELRSGRAPWLDATGFVLRGYRSKLDDSIQPYGLVVPPTWRREQPNRLMVWLLGRGEKRTELAFLAERRNQPPRLAPKNAILLIPYGRYCNATKFAGEVDVFEAIAAVKEHNVIDPLRIAIAGFSMGGASTWHLATHHAGLWCVASPGAGFAETPVYTQAFAPGKEPPTWWEQKLWRWYDSTANAATLFNCPTIAYSGELDPQIQAANIMETTMAAEGLKLERLIGPKTPHRYDRESQRALTSRLEAFLDHGRSPIAREIRVTTHTLRHTGATWIDIRGLERHWERADLHARLADDSTVTIETKNITAVTVPFWVRAAVIDGERLTLPVASAGQQIWLARTVGQARVGAGEPGPIPPAGWHVAEKWRGLHKDRGLSGPINDAFMEPFIFVRPTGTPFHPATGRWAEAELAHARKMWRDIFRGELTVWSDASVSDEDIANRNLVLWGDPSSNRILAKILPHLPLMWNARQLVFRGQSYDAAHHAPILIFPNPLNPARYVVLNSGIDFRDHAYGTNALQIAKLPDYAIVDLRKPPGPRWPGKIVDAGFFDETWSLAQATTSLAE